MPEPRIAHALFCDEIRTDSAGKMSFLGVHSQPLMVDARQRGTNLKLAVVAWLICDPDDVPPSIKISVYGPPGKRLLAGSEAHPGTPPRRPDSTKAFVQLTLERVNVPVSQEGDLEVHLTTDSGVLRAGRLPIRLAAPQAARQAGGG